MQKQVLSACLKSTEAAITMIPPTTSGRKNNNNLGACSLVFSFFMLIADIYGLALLPDIGCFALHAVYVIPCFIISIGTGIAGIIKDEREIIAIIGIIIGIASLVVFILLIQVQTYGDCIF